MAPTTSRSLNRRSFTLAAVVAAMMNAPFSAVSQAEDFPPTDAPSSVAAATPTYSPVLCITTWPSGYSEVECTGEGFAGRFIVPADLSACPAFLDLPDPMHLGGTYSFWILASETMPPESIRDLMQTGELRPNATPWHWPQTLPSLGGTLVAVPLDTPADAESFAGQHRATRAMELLLADYAKNQTIYRAQQAERARTAAALPSAETSARPHPPRPPQLIQIEILTPEESQALREGRATPADLITPAAEE